MEKPCQNPFQISLWLRQNILLKSYQLDLQENKYLKVNYLGYKTSRPPHFHEGACLFKYVYALQFDQFYVFPVAHDVVIGTHQDIYPVPDAAVHGISHHIHAIQLV